MTTSFHPSQLAFFPEVTQGTPPADAAAWASGGTRIRHVGESLDPSQIGQAVVEDMRSQLGIFHLNTKVKGLRNTSFPHDTYLTGSGGATAPAAQIATNPLATFLGHCLGGLSRSNTTVVTGGTTLNPTVTATTNLAVGQLVGFVDTSEGSGRILAVREITAINTLTLTLDDVLPFTPANGDVMHAMATAYVDETVLVNSAVGPTTWSWLIQKGLAAALENFQLMGCKSALTNIELPRGELPLLKCNTLAANFVGPESAPSPTWVGDPSGSAPVALGPTTEWQYQTVGTTTANLIQQYGFNLDVGVPVVPIDTNSEVQANMQGRQAYTTAPADTICKLGIDYAATPWTQFAADTAKYLRFAKIALPGQVIAIKLRNCEINGTPRRGRNGDVSSAELELRARPDTTAATQLAQSKLLIAIG
jgi:hypothetical protein